MKTLDVVDYCDQFDLTVAKWRKISRAMMDARFSRHYKNDHTCKNKCTLYWAIHTRSKTTHKLSSMDEDYWVLSTQNMNYLDLPKQYIKEIYVIIESFLNSLPTFCPTLVQEWMATSDGVYRSLIGTNNYSEPLEKFQPINIDDCIWFDMLLGYDEYIGMPPMPSITTPQQNPSPLMLQNASPHVGSSVYKVPTLN